MNLFKKEDININSGMKITKNKEILLNIVANKGGWINLTFTKICNGKDMFHIQNEANNFLKTSSNHSLKSWEDWLDKKCIREYGLSLNDVCKILGNRLYNWLLDTSQLPTPEQAKELKRRRVGVDEEDKGIIKNSVKYYNITKDDCIKWVYNLIVHRNYKGANAQQKIKDIIEEHLKKLCIDANVKLSDSYSDSKGIDLIIEKDGKTLKFQIKRKTFDRYKSIQKHYDESYDNDINYIIYNDEEKFEICNQNHVLRNLLKKFL
jgi:hypothetical protein